MYRDSESVVQNMFLYVKSFPKIVKFDNLFFFQYHAPFLYFILTKDEEWVKD